MRKAPVLIIGGGPVGLSLSLLLSRLGVPSLLVEKRPGTSQLPWARGILPWARGINCQTAEIWRMRSRQPGRVCFLPGAQRIV